MPAALLPVCLAFRIYDILSMGTKVPQYTFCSFGQHGRSSTAFSAMMMHLMALGCALRSGRHALLSHNLHMNR